VPSTANSLPGVKTAIFDGYLAAEVIVTYGILATLDQADAEAWVIYEPLR
jgi:hypothetical protein